MIGRLMQPFVLGQHVLNHSSGGRILISIRLYP